MKILHAIETFIEIIVGGTVPHHARFIAVLYEFAVAIGAVGVVAGVAEVEIVANLKSNDHERERERSARAHNNQVDKFDVKVRTSWTWLDADAIFSSLYTE